MTVKQEIRLPDHTIRKFINSTPFERRRVSCEMLRAYADAAIELLKKDILEMANSVDAAQKAIAEIERRRNAENEEKEEKPYAKAVNAGDCIRATARYFRISPNEITSHSRRREIVYARTVAIGVIKKVLPEMSGPAIGRRMGGRDHSTIIHSVRKLSNDATAQKEVNAIVKMMADDKVGEL